MQTIISPIDKELLKKELTRKHFLRPTNKAENEIYDITYLDAPNVMREIGRLREESYRAGGGGTGLDCDIDEMDTMENPYHQLIVWNPETEEIIGGYRYIIGPEVKLQDDGQPFITSSHLIYYSRYFIKDYLPATIELGRAFVQPKYQSREMGVKSLFALDNLWDGIGAVLAKHSEIKYLIGKVTIYPQYDAISRDLIYAYLQRFCADNKRIAWARNPIELSVESQELADETFVGTDVAVNYHILQKAVRTRGTVIPSMFSAYLNLTSKMQTFGTSINDSLGGIYDTGIMVTINEIHEEKKLRYITTYLEYVKQLLQKHDKRRRLTSTNKEKRQTKRAARKATKKQKKTKE